MFYNGKENLREAGVAIPLTEEQILEWQRCSEDYEYFIENYVKVLDADSRLMILFKLRSYQKKLLDTIHNSRWSCVKFSRQSGKSTSTMAYFLWAMIFHENYSALIAANKLSSASEIMSRMKSAYEELPYWIKPGVINWSTLSIGFENGSKVRAEATTSNSGRSGTYNAVMLDEFAFIKKTVADEFFASALPTITAGDTTKLVVISTPNGTNLFHKLWTDGVNGKNGFSTVDVLWSDVPGRDENFKRSMIEKIGIDKWMQEFEGEFVGASNSLIAMTTLKTLTSNPEIKRIEDLHIWEEPIDDHTYFITVDTSRGKGLDYSAFIVFDVTEWPIRVVARYRNDTIPVMLYPSKIHAAARHYNNAMVLVETNDAGGQVADILHWELECENVMFTTAHQGKSATLEGMGGKDVGVRTTSSVKRVGCANLKAIVESGGIVLNDEALIDELRNFVMTKASYAAMEGYNDDLVMCCVLMAWATTQQYYKDVTNTDVRNDTFKRQIEQIAEELPPAGYVSGAEEKESKIVTDPKDEFFGWSKS